MANLGRPRRPRKGWVGADGIGHIPVAREHIALVDAEDLDRLTQWNWHLDSNGYAKTHVPLGGHTYRSVRMHQMVLLAPPGMEIDHISRDTLDNRKCNLRIATRTENQQNKVLTQRQGEDIEVQGGQSIPATSIKSLGCTGIS